VLPARSVSDHPTDALALLPPGAPHHPVAEQRPEERDSRDAERDKEERMMSPPQFVVDIREEEDGEVEDDCEEGGEEEEARWVGELPLA